MECMYAFACVCSKMRDSKRVLLVCNDCALYLYTTQRKKVSMLKCVYARAYVSPWGQVSALGSCYKILPSRFLFSLFLCNEMNLSSGYRSAPHHPLYTIWLRWTAPSLSQGPQIGCHSH